MAYYSNQGTPIHSGAAGYGKLRSFRDGSLGNLQAYRDGSLGVLEAFQDGSLGAAPLDPLTAFKDGSLGMPLFLKSKEGLRRLEEPVTIYHGSGEYFQGAGEYFTGTSGCHGCGAVATGPAPAGAPSFNLNDAATAQEFKLAITAAPWVFAPEGLDDASRSQLAEVIQEDLSTPAWTPVTTQLVDSYITGMPLSEGQTREQLFAELDPEFPLPDRYPTLPGVVRVGFNALTLAQAGLVPPGTFPILQQFLNDQQAAGGGRVIPPGKSAGSNMLLIGLGVAGMALVGMAVMGKKKR